MQRPVKLYTVEEQLVMAYDRVSFVRKRGLGALGSSVFNEDAILDTIERVDVPVRKLVDVEYDSTGRKATDLYLAIDPKLEYMISLPWKEERDSAIARSHAAMSQMMLYQDRISDYNSLPWYKRIFRRV